VSLSLTVEDGAALPVVIRDLEGLGEVRVEPRKAIICVVGEGLRTTPGIAARVFETIRDINVSLISQGASRVNLTFVVDEDQVREAVVRLHGALLDRAATADRSSVPSPPVRRSARSPARPPVADLARQLIDIPSISGDEEAVARFLAGYLRDLGYGVTMLDGVPGRPGLLARTAAPPRVVFCTHLDTVAPHVPASEDDTFLYGRGACDAKGIIAAQVAAAERLRAEGFDEVGLLFVVDEERGSLGARAANAHPAAGDCRFLIVGEPTENRLAVGSKGSLRLTLRCEGTGGHSAYPERGRSAIHTLVQVLADVQAVAWPRDPYFGDTTCNIGLIGGGEAANVIAPAAHAELHLRLATDQAPVRELLECAVGGHARIEYQSFTQPVRLTPVPGFEQCVVGFTTDVPHLSSWGTPLLLGPGSIHDAHTARERVDKAELERGVEYYVRLARQLAS
jgi:acetylornithine deacetylase